jgi:hypothetical protein
MAVVAVRAATVLPMLAAAVVPVYPVLAAVQHLQRLARQETTTERLARQLRLLPRQQASKAAAQEVGVVQMARLEPSAARLHSGRLAAVAAAEKQTSQLILMLPLAVRLGILQAALVEQTPGQ